MHASAHLAAPASSPAPPVASSCFSTADRRPQGPPVVWCPDPKAELCWAPQSWPPPHALPRISSPGLWLEL